MVQELPRSQNVYPKALGSGKVTHIVGYDRLASGCHCQFENELIVWVAERGTPQKMNGRMFAHRAQIINKGDRLRPPQPQAGRVLY